LKSEFQVERDESMQPDVRGTAWYREAEDMYKSIRRPASGQISDAAEIHVAPNGSHAVFAGTIVDQLDGAPTTRICEVDLKLGDTRVLTIGPNTDRLPKYSPDGRQIAFLSSRRQAGDFQLYLLDRATQSIRATSPVDGWVEYLHWSPDGRQILLGVAGHGADVAGAQGAVTSRRAGADAASWMPSVDTGEESYRWRRAWVYEVATDSVRQVSPAETNVWEAVWWGPAAIAAVVSPGPGEGLWYGASLQVIELETGRTREVFKPRDQLGWPAASPSGAHLAIVEAICSDRWFVAGELRLVDTVTGQVETVETGGVDITYTEWRSDHQLLLAGHRGFETVVGLYDRTSIRFTEVWRSSEVTTGGFYATVSGFNDVGDCVLVAEGFKCAPTIAVVRNGEYRSVKSFDLGYEEHARAIEAVRRVSWRAPDSLEIDGWLLQPSGQGPYPLVMSVHGGPVWQWRPLWLGRYGAAVLMLVKRGFAIFYPNPRGSTGRGQGFARRVVGDMGGADTHDYLSGLDYLIEQGIADPRRLGVTGISYGGYMTAWLITQDERFAAAVPVAPVTNFVTEYLISNIPHWLSLFIADSYTNPGGGYYQRSPIMFANKARTPTLNICGALDRSAPPEEAVQFHRALKAQGVTSALVIYPEEGHGVRKFPAVIDYAARVAAWFYQHMAP
jgi:dipeptidyl aminopeptidase/acylaminoacyl peptidase